MAPPAPRAGSAALPVLSKPQGSTSSTAAVTNAAEVALHDDTDVDNVGKMDHGVKELLAAINQLEELGMDKLVVDLPKIVAVGDQSAGKSSTIEAISQIRVPRSTGTCTRCPFHINLIHSEEKSGGIWSCTVEIHHKYSYEGVKRGHPTGSPFPGWRLNHQPLITHFKKTMDQTAVEGVLHRAQIAVLNPNDDPRKYADKADIRTTLAVQFSPNPIVVNITGPQLPDLSLVDLPGIITQTEDGKDTHLPKVVQNLAKEYISPKNTVVLLACSMEGDIANSNASSLLRKLKAEQRTIGILTKPDRLPKGDPIELWHSILAGEKYPLKHAYYVTKQPSQVQIARVDHAQAREDEAQFFETQEPWCKELAGHNSRFGTRKLQERLSALLASTISSNLPDIRAKIDERLQHIDHELRQIPEPPSTNAVHVVISHIHEFVNAISTAVDGVSPRCKFRHEWKGLKKAFGHDLYALRPKLLMVSNSKPKIELVSQDVVEISDSDGDLVREPVPVTPKKRRLDQDEVFTPQGRKTAPVVNAMAMPPKKFSTDEIRKLIKQYSTSDLPNEVDPRVTEFMVAECLQQWGTASSKLFQGLKKRLEATTQNVFEDVLGKFAKTDLFTKTWDLLQNFIGLHFGLQFGNGQGACDRVLRLELYRPLTEDETSWEHNRLKELEIFHAARYRYRANQYFDNQEASTNREIKKADRERKIDNDASLRAQIGEDPDEVAVQVMAKVRGYYNIASSRYCDVVCMSIQGELFRAIRDELLEELMEGLNASDQDACIQLLAEDPEREAKRQDLKRQWEALAKAQQVLDNLTLKYHDDTTSSDTTMEADEDEEAPPSPSDGRSRNSFDRQAHDDIMDEAV